MPAPYAIRLEIAPIDREDFRRAERFRRHDQRGIREIHGVVGVLLHQLERPLQGRAVEEPDQGPGTDDEIAQIAQKLQTLESARRQIVPSVHPEYLSRYDRILQNRDGLGLVAVKGHSCGGCYMNVPDQVINQIKMYDQLIFCEMCARLLYLEEEL